jgi:hypothetical protein
MTIPSHIPPSLTEQFKTVIDTFGTFHPKSRDWNLPQKLLLTELGIEEARLLAWGDAIGINGTGRLRLSPAEPPFVVEDHLDNIHIQLQILISLQTETKQSEAQQRIGLRPYPHEHFPEPALDSTRLEAFLERQRRLHMNSEKGGRMKHYYITDNAKFKIEYLHKIRDIVSGLVASTNDESYVEIALLQDIKAMAWHPVFEEGKASHDSSKLQVIRQACQTLYPSYSAAATRALVHLNQEWQEYHEEVMERQRPVLQEAQRSSYRRKSIISRNHGLPLVFKHGHGDGKQSSKGGKITAGVFAKIFRRRSTHLPEREKNGKPKDKIEETTSQETPRAMSV